MRGLGPLASLRGRPGHDGKGINCGNLHVSFGVDLSEHRVPAMTATGNRRPIAARELSWSRAVAGWLARRGATANAISLAGLACGLAGGLALAATSWTPRWAWACWLIGALLVQLRLAANMFDGMVAIETATASKLGELYNEIPDRVSDSATLIGLGYAAGGDVVLGYAAALAAVATAYVRAVGVAAGARAEFCGPMAKQQRMFVVTLVAIYGAATAAIGWRVADLDPVPWLALLVIVLGSLLTAARRLLRIAATLRGT